MTFDLLSMVFNSKQNAIIESILFDKSANLTIDKQAYIGLTKG